MDKYECDGCGAKGKNFYYHKGKFYCEAVCAKEIKKIKKGLTKRK